MCPLDGLQVVECGFVAGPTGRMTLAQLGASVIRIEPLGGGPDHGCWPVTGRDTGRSAGESYYRASSDKGKRSITVDLRSDEGESSSWHWRPHSTTIAACSSTTSSDADGSPTTYSNARIPDLTHVRVQAYRHGRPAVDYTVNAKVGISQVTGNVDGGAPVDHVLSAWDLVSGMSMSTACRAARWSEAGAPAQERAGDEQARARLEI